MAAWCPHAPRSPPRPLASAGGPASADALDEGVRFESVAVEGNPLGLAIGRYSADLEYLPVPHHALHLTPLAYYALPGTGDRLTGFGAEVGYRWYSGARELLYGPGLRPRALLSVGAAW